MSGEAVTFPAKRYVFVCLGCGGLSDSDRKDQMTCSTACRVRAHRTGETKRTREAAQNVDVPVATMLRAGALSKLCPALGDRVAAGELKLNDAFALDAVRAEYKKLIERELIRSQEATP